MPLFPLCSDHTVVLGLPGQCWAGTQLTGPHSFLSEVVIPWRPLHKGGGGVLGQEANPTQDSTGGLWDPKASVPLALGCTVL